MMIKLPLTAYLAKILVLILGVISLVTSPLYADPPKVYGRLSASLYDLEREDTNGTPYRQGHGVQLRHSFLGLEGYDNINRNARFFYRYEQGFDRSFDNQDDMESERRDMVVGINSRNIGSFILGNYRTALSRSGVDDLFLGMDGNNRFFGDRSYYYPPSFNYVSAIWKRSRISLSLLQADVNDTSVTSSFTDAYSWAYMYGNKKRGIFFSLAETKHNPISNYSLNRDKTQRISFGMAIKNFSIGLYVEKNTNDLPRDDNEGGQLQMSYRLNQLVPKVKWGNYFYKNDSSDNTDATTPNSRGFTWAVDYHLSKRSLINIQSVSQRQGDATYSGILIGMSQKF